MQASYTNIYKTALEPTKRVDLAIIGGGCAGLSLARELASLGTNRSVVILEPRTHYQDDRSWCFWSAQQHALTHLVCHSWPQWRFGQQGKTVQMRGSEKNPYQYIRSADFYRDSLEKIAHCPSIAVELGITVHSVTRAKEAWHIETNQEHIVASHVIDTRPPSREQFAQATLYQCFLGAEIQLSAGITTDVSTLELMTDMRLIDGEFGFTYLLPLAHDRLLIELTLFAVRPYTAEELKKGFEQLLDARGLSQSTVLRSEYGNLPMGLPLEQHDHPRAGMGGGALRPSSGYGFMRIQRWAALCAKHYVKDDTVIAQASAGFWLQKMDELFLTVIKTQPTLAPTLFDRLLGQVQTERFIRFMNDRAGWIDYLYIVLCLPKTPFLKALFAHIIQKK